MAWQIWPGAKKKSTNKIQQLLGTNISEIAGAISFKFGIQGRVYGPTKIYKFDRNQPNS